MRSITLSRKLAANPPITEADEIMGEVSAQLGGKWGTVKLSGIWLVWRELGSPLSGDAQKGQPLRRSFKLALLDAMKAVDVEIQGVA